MPDKTNSVVELASEDSMGIKKRPTTVSSKLLKIIEVFTPQEPHLSLSEISRKTGIPLATSYRFVNEWVTWGGLVRLPDGRYEVGTKLWEIGVQSPSLQVLRNAALPFLEDVLAETKQTAQLAILEGFDALYVEKLVARNSTVTISRVGSRLPLHATGVGLVLLAHSSADFVDEFLKGTRKKYTPYTVTDANEIRQRLIQIRRLGVIRVDEELHYGVASFAAPIKDRTGRTIAAISAVVPVSQKDDKTLELLVRVAGVGTSRVLGYKGNK